MTSTNLIVNFCRHPNVLSELIIENKINKETIQVIDLTGTLSQIAGVKLYSPMNDDVDFNIKKQSHLLLAQRIGEIADKLGKYNICGLSLFWQTTMAEKHDYYSVFGKITYFELLIASNQKLYSLIENSENIYLTFPINTGVQTHRLVKQIIRKKNRKANIKSNYKRFKLLKHKLIIESIFFRKVSKSLFRKRLTNTSIDAKNGSDFTPFIFLTRNLRDHKQKPEYILSQKLGDKIENLDLSESIEDNFSEEKVFSLNKCINDKFNNAAPSKTQVLFLISNVIRLKVLFFFQRIFKIKGEPLLHNCARYEMSRILLNFDGLMIFTWYKNYFKQIQEKRIFLITDEFYKVGRLICNAKISSGSSNIKIIGLQHGMFGEAHTVYKITDSELKGRYPLPIPDHFIVWGDFFRRFFMKFNTLPLEYIKVASYLDFQDATLNKSKPVKKRILWCTTLPEIALFDFNLLESYPDIDNYDILLRQHPSFKITEFIESKIQENNKLWKRISIATSNSINDAIQSSDLVLTPSPSTVVLDSLLNKTPVLYTDCGYRICDFKDDFNAGIYVVKNQEEFNLKFNLAINQKSLDKKSLSYYVNNKPLEKVLTEIISE